MSSAASDVSDEQDISPLAEHAGLLEQHDFRKRSPANMDFSSVIRRIASKSLSVVRRSVTSFTTASTTVTTAATEQKLPPTAWLAGVRGVAALVVFNLHHMEWAHVSDDFSIIKLENPFGMDGIYCFASLPFVRIFFTGGHMTVPILFIISGYVLAARPFRQIHAGDTDGLAATLSSAFFRRWFRLFLPILATTFIWMTSWHVFGYRSSHPASPAPAESYITELILWARNFLEVSFFGSGKPDVPYNEHTWAIPEEFRGSLVIYIATLALASHTPAARLAFEFGLLVYLMMLVQPACLFVVGMILCDLEVLSEVGRLPQFLQRIQPKKQWMWYILLLAGLYMGGVPGYSTELDDFAVMPGWHIFYLLLPPDFPDFRGWYRFWGAVCTFAAIPHIPWLKSWFEWKPLLLLGRLSYALYLIHGPVLWSLGDRVYALFGRGRGNVDDFPGWYDRLALPSAGPIGLELNFVVPYLVMLVITLGLSELTTHIIDIPSAKFAKWLYTRGLEVYDGGLLNGPKQGVRVTVEEEKIN